MKQEINNCQIIIEEVAIATVLNLEGKLDAGLCLHENLRFF